MSDAKEDKDNELSFDKPQNKPKTTQQAPRSFDDDSTLVFDEAHSSRRKRKKDYDPTQDTAVLSKNDRRMKRILNSHKENDSTMSLGDKQEVILLVRGMVERIMMQTGTSYKLGRFELGMNEDDEIDLTPYGAQDRGVSRIHAELQIIEGVVHITDLGSTNGTFVNSKRLEADTPTPLRKGDEVLVGRLNVQVLFR